MEASLGECFSIFTKKTLEECQDYKSCFQKRSLPPMLFFDKNFQEIDHEQDDLMVITVEIIKYAITKTLVDQGSSLDILF